MYTKDKNHRITVRLNEEQFLFLNDQAEILGVTPAEFLRMVVNSSLAIAKKTEGPIKANLNNKGEYVGEHKESNINCII